MVSKQIFLDYQDLFETSIARFLEEECMSPERLADVVGMVKRRNEEGKDVEDTYDAFQLLLSFVEFDTFFQRMKREATFACIAEEDALDMGL